jgi:hypothetical protein
MNVDEKIRALLNPRLREIHQTTGGILSMGDLAVYVGQPMQDAMTELAEFVQLAALPPIKLATAFGDATPEECMGSIWVCGLCEDGFTYGRGEPSFCPNCGAKFNKSVSRDSSGEKG